MNNQLLGALGIQFQRGAVLLHDLEFGAKRVTFKALSTLDVYIL